MKLQLQRDPTGIVFASALYDFAVTAPFSTPWSARWVEGLLRAAHERWQLPGQPLTLDDPHTLLFANLLGTVVLVWAFVRLRHPSRELGLADTVARGAFAAWMLYALSQGSSALLWGFAVPEVLWAVVQAGAVWWPPRPTAYATNTG
jgi:hypothetical protein